MRLLLILAVLALASVPKIVLWEFFFARSRRLVGPGNPLETLEIMLFALAAVLVSMFALLWVASRARV